MGKRFSIHHTRALLNAALTGKLHDVEFYHDPVFGFEVPKCCEGVQAGDLLAWCHNLYLTSNGKIPTRYERTLDRLSTVANEWTLIHMHDPHRIPAILQIPERDPKYRYKSIIVRKDGERKVVTHYWRREQATEPKLYRNTLVPSRISQS